MRALVEIEEPDPAAAVAAARSIEELLAHGAKGLPQLHHGSGVATWAVLSSAVARGHSIRVGLEDTLVHADGALAADNADLVRRAAGL